MTGVVQTFELSKRFRTGTVLDGLDLNVPEGSVYALVGPNGAGKTTTLKILMNALTPSAGRAEVLGRNSRDLSAEDFERIGYISENQQMPESMTVGYFLRYLKPFYRTWDDARCSDLLRLFDLPHDRKLKHLSRGMWMKTAITSSLAFHPRLIVLDEPFTGLDSLVRDQVAEALLDSANEATVLISSHDLAEIESFASHVGYLGGGRLRFSEDMNSLAARFREVQVSFDTGQPVPSHWPPGWLHPETCGAVTRFIETHFEPERTVAAVRDVFGEVHDISIHPMPLRAIFVAVAKASGKGA